MRVAVYGNLANSAYIHTRLLRRAGIEAELVIDPLDRYVMSDPRWEDLDLELESSALASDALPPAELPEWVRDDAAADASAWGRRVHTATAAIRHFDALGAAWRSGGRRAVGYVGIYARVVHRLSRYDCALVFGLGPIVASLARIPFVTLPFGGDITIVPFADGDGWQGQPAAGVRPSGGPAAHIAALQRHGLQRTDRILVCDPGFFGYIERLGLADKALPFRYAIDTDMYSPAAEPQLRAQLLGPDKRILVFVPSRQDWYWKGSDRMLKGYARAVADRDDALLVCAGWGTDLERSRKLIDELDIRSRVLMLDHAMSKPRLLRYYRAADIVMDQFTLGAYGGSSLEAMSCARPLLIHLDPDAFTSRLSGIPPVVNVREPEQIASELTRLFDDPDLRTRIGGEAREWVLANHGPSLIAQEIELCREASARSATR
jgi:glycosyltransferase involved in cell wall biosynthesis